MHHPLQPGTTQYTIVDDDVEAAPIYRCEGKAAAYKTSQESWPAYRVYTYMNGESMKAADMVISSSCTRIIGKYFQNPGNTEMHVTSVVRLRFATHTVPYGLMINEPFE